MEIIQFTVNPSEEGGFYTEAVGLGIFAEGDTIDDLEQNILSGISCYYDDNEVRTFTLIY